MRPPRVASWSDTGPEDAHGVRVPEGACREADMRFLDGVATDGERAELAQLEAPRHLLAAPRVGYPRHSPVFTTATRDQVLAILVQDLTPYVGVTMASASVRGLCKKLELEGATLGRAEVERLIDALAPGLHVYVGKEKARAIVGAIWTAMDAIGARP
jgi:hypothetical protein